jgi:hypothetical protein
MQEYDKEKTNYGPAIAPLYWQSWCTEKNNNNN